MANRNHALLIGINEYPNLRSARGGHDLNGCVNDVERMATVLRG